MEAHDETAAPPPGKIFDPASQSFIDDPAAAEAEAPAAEAPAEEPKPSTAPDATAPGDPNPPPPSAAQNAEPNFVVLAGPKPGDGKTPTFVEVERIIARSGDEAKRAARKLPSIVAAVAQHGALAIACVPLRSWTPELLAPAEPVEPPLKATRL